MRGWLRSSPRRFLFDEGPEGCGGCAPVHRVAAFVVERYNCVHLEGVVHTDLAGDHFTPASESVSVEVHVSVKECLTACSVVRVDEVFL